MTYNILIFIALISTTNSYAQFLTAESPQIFSCELEEEGLKAEIEFESDTQFLTIKILKGSDVIRRTRGVVMLTEHFPVNPEHTAIKILELGQYRLTKKNGYTLNYPSLGGAWAGSDVDVSCSIEE